MATTKKTTTKTASKGTTTKPRRRAPKAADELSRIISRATAKSVAPIELRPNPRNYKPMNEKEMAKEVASIKKYGLVTPVVVRSGNGTKDWAGGYEVIDGEHRWKAIMEIGAKTIHIMDIGDASDTEADELMVVLNELHGKPQYDALGSLIANLAEQSSIGELLEVMPFPEDELRALAVMPTDPMSTYGTGGADEKDEPDKSKEKWKAMTMLLSEDMRVVIEAAIASELTTSSAEGPEDVKAGIALERICRQYLGAEE